MVQEATSVETAAPPLVTPRRRLRGEDRREALLEAARLELAEGGSDAVTMETVAARANVSRPLVYKHFTNRDELLGEVFRQERTRLDATIVAAVSEAEGFEAKLRAMIRTVLEAEASYGPTLAPLHRAHSHDPAFRREQRSRDERTVRFFARLAATEYRIGRAEATATVSVLLTGIESVRAQWRARPTARNRRFLEQIYVDLVVGGLERISQRSTEPPA